MGHFHDGREWFFRHRLGLFIHWGLYAIHGIHEQEQQRFNVPADEYRKLIDRFTPGKFNPDSWLDLMQENGFEYLVFTTKHHDGFCLWPSHETAFHVGNTPFRRDVVGELAEACRRRGIPLEFYYSIVDWNQENYPNVGRHHEIVTDSTHHNWNLYLEFLKRQITELCTNYGTIHGIWWDMNVPEARAPEVHELIRRLQPAAVINNRGFAPGDYSTPERDFDPESANPDSDAKRLVEACQSAGVNSWGFRNEEDYYSIRYFLNRIDRTLAAGGNYLLNVGPDADGVIPPPAVEILRGVGRWFRKVREALEAEPAPGLLENQRLPATRQGNILYIHCPEVLESSTLSLRPLERAPRRVTLLNTDEAIDWTLEPIVYDRGKGAALRLRNIPVNQLHSTVPIFKLEFD